MGLGYVIVEGGDVTGIVDRIRDEVPVLLQQGHSLSVRDVIQEIVRCADTLIAVVVISPKRVDAGVNDALVEVDDIGCRRGLLGLVRSGCEQVVVNHRVPVDYRRIECIGKTPDGVS